MTATIPDAPDAPAGVPPTVMRLVHLLALGIDWADAFDDLFDCSSPASSGDAVRELGRAGEALRTAIRELCPRATAHDIPRNLP